jgi:radical SAM superfamily enzyme YgiQ (UPF0313 family)
MRVALVNPRIETYSSTLPPLGLLYIASVLEKENIEVKVFDPHPHDDGAIQAIIDYKPDILGFSILTTYIFRAKKIISTLRQSLKAATYVVGGIHPTVLPEESLSFLDADIAVVSEGEHTMKEIVRNLSAHASLASIKGIVYKDCGKIVKNPPRELIEDLDSVPFPARHLLNFEKYLFPPGIIRGYWSERSTTVITSRGCPYHCIYCGSQAIFGHKTRRRSVNDVMNELEHLVRQYRVDSIWFIDDTFTLNKAWLHEFCDRLMKSGWNLKWGCQARVNTVNEETLALMKKAGLVQLDFGVESGSDRVLKALRKDSSEDTIRNAFRIAKKVGVRTMATFIFGNPEETKEDVDKTFALAKEINPNFVSSFFLTPFPGTELMDLVRMNKWDMDLNYLETGLKKRPPLRINFTDEELLGFRERFQRQFFFRNYTSLFLNVPYMAKATMVVLRYPWGVWHGLKAFRKSRVFDDFVFGFLLYYADKKQR